jgi:hypothetical protein
VTFAWGALGFILAGFSTGYIFVRATHIERFLPPLAGPFAFSLVINCILVQIAVFAGVYSPGNVRVFALAAGSVSVVFLLTDRRLDLNGFSNNLARLKWRIAWRGEHKLTTAVNIVVVILAAISIVGVIQLLAKTSGSIITGYDPVAQWNLWAVDWGNNRPPSRIYHYPQLVPILWSIPYAAMGNASIEFFSSSFKFVFWLLMFETLIYLALRCRDLFLVASVPITSSLLRSVVGRSSLEDYIDVPVALLSLVAVAILLPPRMGSRAPARIISASFLLASGAAMTKQVGLYMIGAMPLLVLGWEMSLKPQLAALFRTTIGLSWRAALAACLCAPIYIYAVVTIAAGTNDSEFGYLFEGIFQQPTRLARAADGFRSVFAALSWPEIAALFAANIAVLWDRRYRWILLVICVPFTLLWAFFFGYDARNLALTVPFWGLTTAVGLKIILVHIQHAPFWTKTSSLSAGLADGLKFLNRGIVALSILTAVTWLIFAQNRRFPEQQLIAIQNQDELEKLAEEENRPTVQMLSLMKEIGDPVRIFSEWRWACSFHFNRNGNCLRIFPDDFFRSIPAGALDRTTSVLLILFPSSVDQTREQILANDGFVEKPCYACQGVVRTFVRLRPP